jgi:hypothetical protein
MTTEAAATAQKALEETSAAKKAVELRKDEAEFNHSHRSIVYNGHVYKSLAGHGPHSRDVVNEYNKLYNLDSDWRICPKTPDALHVCATYPWASCALVFGDGSAHWTALAEKPGAEAWSDSRGCLRKEGERYGVSIPHPWSLSFSLNPLDWFRPTPDPWYDGDSNRHDLAEAADVLIVRKL